MNLIDLHSVETALSNKSYGQVIIARRQIDRKFMLMLRGLSGPALYALKKQRIDENGIPVIRTWADPCRLFDFLDHHGVTAGHFTLESTK